MRCKFIRIKIVSIFIYNAIYKTRSNLIRSFYFNDSLFFVAYPVQVQRMDPPQSFLKRKLPLSRSVPALGIASRYVEVKSRPLGWHIQFSVLRSVSFVQVRLMAPSLSFLKRKLLLSAKQCLFHFVSCLV